MKLATTTSDFAQHFSSNIDTLAHIKDAGFKYVDYSFIIDYVNGSGIFSEDEEGYLAALKKEAQRLGLTFVQSHAPMARPIVEDENYLPFIEANKKCIRACAALGIKTLVVHSGYDKGISKEECFERNRKFYMPLLEEGKKYGVYILTENFNKMDVEGVYWIDNAPDLKELVDFVNHPYFKCCWDTGHANHQAMPQHEALELLGNRVMALHVQDNRGENDSHVAPFTGSLNIDSLIYGLKKIDFKGYFTFEATEMLLNERWRRKFEADTRLLKAPLHLRKLAETLLYETGKHILSQYDMFEE